MRRLTLLALLAFACGAVPAQAQTLSLGYHSGDTFKYSFHSTTKQTIVASGVSLPADVDISANDAVKVVSVDSAGAASIAVAARHFASNGTTGGVSTTTTGIPHIARSRKVGA